MRRIVLLWFQQQGGTIMTFMQRYREFKRLNTQVRPIFDERIIRAYGHKLAGQFDRMSALENRIAGFDVHGRINYRSEASTKPNWGEMAAHLNKMWYSFR